MYFLSRAFLGQTQSGTVYNLSDEGSAMLFFSLCTFISPSHSPACSPILKDTTVLCHLERLVVNTCDSRLPLIRCVQVARSHPLFAPSFAPSVLDPHRHGSAGKSRDGKLTMFPLTITVVYAHTGHATVGRRGTSPPHVVAILVHTHTGGHAGGLPLPLLSPPLPLTHKWEHKCRRTRSDKGTSPPHFASAPSTRRQGPVQEGFAPPPPPLTRKGTRKVAPPFFSSSRLCSHSIG
jgi:hypothetical protein